MVAIDLETRAELAMGLPRYKFTRADALIRNLAPTCWLVRDYIEAGSTAMLFADAESGKSLLAIDWGLCIATGRSWAGFPVQQGAVAYLTGEGREGIRRRVLAWSIRNGVDLAGVPFYRSDFTADLSNPEAAMEVGDAIAALDATPALVVVDTVSRHLGGDENSSQDVARFVQHLDALVREPTGAAVLLVHHSGHGDKSRARGSTVLRASVDAEYRLTRQGDTGLLLLACTKAKDHERPPERGLRIAGVELPIVGADGHAETSAILDPAELPEVVAAPSLGTNQRKALATLQAIQTEQRERVAATGRDPGNARVLIEDWRKATGLDRYRWREVRDGLAAKGVIRLQPPFVEACE